VLGRYVREKKAMPLAEAVRKMTSLPASRIRLAARGRVVPGAAADIVIFDPAAVADRATFDDPFQYPAGMLAVVVNGAVALRDGERRAGRGRTLRPSA
jgi:N-acyl-D-aspartate/D-glutamate deacylase